MKKKTKKNKSRKYHTELPMNIIEAASKGDVEAVERTLKHFDGYISVLSAKTLYDEYGNAHIFVDEDKRRHLEIKFITNLLKYNAVPEQAFSV